MRFSVALAASIARAITVARLAGALLLAALTAAPFEVEVRAGAFSPPAASAWSTPKLVASSAAVQTREPIEPLRPR